MHSTDTAVAEDTTTTQDRPTATVVSYGHEVHVYGPGDDASAETVYLVGVATYGDGYRSRIPAGNADEVIATLRGVQLTVVDHRRKD